MTFNNALRIMHIIEYIFLLGKLNIPSIGTSVCTNVYVLCTQQIICCYRRVNIHSYILTISSPVVTF